MSDFFLHENILIKYWVDRCSHYKLGDKKIIKAEANKPLSITPDIFKNIFDDNSYAPCEIKWSTSDFKDPEQINKVKELNGFLLVFDRDRDDCPIQQLEIDKKDFEKWFVTNSKRLADDTIKKFKKDNKKRIEPRVYLNYLSTSKSGAKNLKLALDNSTWGSNENDFNRSNKEIKNVKKGDIIIFFYAWKKDKSRIDVKGGRIKIDQYVGSFNKVYALVVTKDYYLSSNPKIWSDKNYPHRFKFRLLFEGNNIGCNKRVLGPALHTFLHTLMSVPRFLKVDSSILLKTLSMCVR